MSKSNATSAEPHVARKRFGQNFLHDPGLIARIIDAIGPQPSDRLVEIGPGQAAITAPLIAAAGHVHAIEIDRDLAARLHERFTSAQLTIDQQDVLRVDFHGLSARLGGKLRIVGNLPYNISSPILFHLLDAADVIVDQHVMLQKEVVDRMVADCGSKIYGRLSVMLQARYRMVRCLLVPPGAFHPAPKVDSAVIRMVPLATDQVRVNDWPIFSAVVALAFSQRRKMLRNTLAGYADALDWQSLGISPTQRAEEVSVEKFIALANYVASLPSASEGGQRIEPGLA
ncbi:MAG: 16S rRNA (adenine(1518)-N(6)/adenine(1519)-N(6))-dimethyltransferase RsmA [Burkholderiaceae bacterium]|nr:16S rRNA (adenine(1518)-N(6)/adenine(1519)-N(6))-dimethyltransferase RsmA [Burkholderiaceae bacterium]